MGGSWLSARCPPRVAFKFMIAVDFETFYSRTHTVADHGPWAYAHHPDTDIYMVAVRGEGFDFVGDPAAFDFRQLNGRDLCSHNAGFDMTVAQAGMSRSLFADFTPRSWSCTADLAAYCGLPRSLADAIQAAFGEHVPKLMRNWMSGKHWSDAVAKGKDKELLDYARRDAELCLRLWNFFGGCWPAHERRLSGQTRAFIWSGVGVNQPLLATQLESVRAARAKAEADIPWAGGGGAILSLAVLRDYCATVGISAPASLAQDSDECAVWEDKFADRWPFIRAVRDYRRSNVLLRKLENIAARVRPDGTMPVNLKYWGGHTGRWSGDAGVNMQNLPRGEMYGAELRRLFRPAPGNSFVICDLSQIEPRVLAWLCDDQKMLGDLRRGLPLYEAHARATMGWTGGKLKSEAPDTYQLAKARVLGLGYGCGGTKFVAVARTMAGLNLTAEEADATVKDWRRTNPLVTAYWRALDAQLGSARICRRDLTYALPSGREMRWWSPAVDPEEPSRVVCASVKNGTRIATWGGKLTENIVQAVARDVFADALLRLESSGINVVWHVHDEVIVECPTEDAPDVLTKVIHTLSTPPEWAVGLPLTAEGAIQTYYTK